MTKGLTDLFNMEDMISENTSAETESENATETSISTQAEPDNNSALMTIDQMKTDRHSKSMDSMHNELIKHARDITDLAFDLDPARAPRMLEVAAMYYKTAMDATISKRDAELKLLKLMNDQRKLSIDEARLRHEMGNVQSDKADVIMVEDRNTLLKRLREEAAKGDK